MMNDVTDVKDGYNDRSTDRSIDRCSNTTCTQNVQLHYNNMMAHKMDIMDSTYDGLNKSMYVPFVLHNTFC